MAVAAIAKTAARVIWLIGARNDGATFDNTVSDDRFIQEEVLRALIETESEIVRAICEGYHPQRASFLGWSSALNHGDLLPAHIGQVEAVQIQPYSGAGYQIGEATTRENIRLWRENYNSRYDAIAHNQNGSYLAGYFNITNNTVVFTGNAAQVKVATFVPDNATPAHQISNEFESGIVAGTIPKLNKVGVPQALIAHYNNQYAMFLTAIRQGLQTLPEIMMAQKMED